jgi:hypothetical protein
MRSALLKVRVSLNQFMLDPLRANLSRMTRSDYKSLPRASQLPPRLTTVQAAATLNRTLQLQPEKRKYEKNHIYCRSRTVPVACFAGEPGKRAKAERPVRQSADAGRDE